jgi:hypothetical protein
LLLVISPDSQRIVTGAGIGRTGAGWQVPGTSYAGFSQVNLSQDSPIAPKLPLIKIKKAAAIRLAAAWG